MFYIVGLGLSDEKDITVRGLEVRHLIERFILMLIQNLPTGRKRLFSSVSRGVHEHLDGTEREAGGVHSSGVEVNDSLTDLQGSVLRERHNRRRSRHGRN